MKKILIINNERDVEDLGWSGKIQEAIQKIEQVEFIVEHHSKLSQDRMEEIDPSRIILTGRVTHHWSLEEILDSYATELELLRTISRPTLGICAGLQLMAIAYGGKFGKMVDSEEDILEEGYTEIRKEKDGDILAGLEETFTCYELHRDEVKGVPNGFELLASTQMCEVQAVKHVERPLYGLQFHPEQYSDDHPDGKLILSNFLNLAK